MWCSAVDSPQNGFMMGVGRQFGDVVRFTCEQGYRLFGQAEITCQGSGQWDSLIPSCHSRITVLLYSTSY